MEPVLKNVVAYIKKFKEQNKTDIIYVSDFIKYTKDLYPSDTIEFALEHLEKDNKIKITRQYDFPISFEVMDI